jgi:hypothetical protein
MAMKIAIMLDMPTSYNYIVKFDKDKHPEITSNYSSPEKANQAYPYGIVSVDFLQIKPGEKRSSKADYDIRDEEGNLIDSYEIDSIDTLSGDRLIQFDDALQEYRIATNSLSNEGNLMKNWIKVADELARKELEGAPQETINKSIAQYDKMPSVIKATIIASIKQSTMDYSRTNFSGNSSTALADA